MKNVALWVFIFLAAYAMLKCNECEVKMAEQTHQTSEVWYANEKR